MELEPFSVADRRLFEDKLAGLVDLPVYVVCVEAEFRMVVEGLGWAVREYGADCMLHADLGGDGVLLGYEGWLGSYSTDAVARAAIARVSELWSVRGVLAAGLVGGEGGGGELSLAEIAATLRYLLDEGVILGVEEPGPESAGLARRLLDYAESGTLPLYLAALEGRERVKIDMAYLHGVYEVKPWYRRVLILDAVRHCRLSPLCQAALRGIAAFGVWRKQRPRPPSSTRR